MRTHLPARASRLAAVVALSTACSSSTSPTAPTSSTDEALGTYEAVGPGLVIRVGFTDATHYWWRRAICPGKENGCVESGTYSVSAAGGSVTFTSDGGDEETLPFAVTATDPESTRTSALRVLGGGLTTGDASGGLGADAGAGDGGLVLSVDGGALTGVPAPLITSFTLGNQSFKRAPASPDASSGAPALSGAGGVQLLSDGGPSTTYPAFAPWLPTVVNNGGSVITPNIVTITWSADPKAATFEAFDDAMAASAYWSDTTSEYGIGRASSTATHHVRITTPPSTTFDGTTIETWIIDQAKSPAKSGWPAPTANTFYAVYLPKATSAGFKYGREMECASGTYGYHAAVTVGSINVAYALIFQCATYSTDDNTSTTSHELVEGSANPFDTKYAYRGFDADHLAWDILQDFQDELADACENLDAKVVNASLTSHGQSYAAQRSWSNAAAIAGHDPCVPAPSQAYFNVTPLDMVGVTITTPKDYDNPTVTGKNPPTVRGLGYSIKGGASKTIDLGLYSDRETTGPWTISAAEGVPWEDPPKKSHVSLSIDHTSGQNGSVAHLTVKVTSVDTSINGELVTIASTLGGVTNYSPILISNN